MSLRPKTAFGYCDILELKMNPIEKRLKKMWRNHWPLFGALIIFFVASAYLIHYYIYQLNPDAVSYIAIAQKYAHFDIRHAINGYWGPLISWLLVPFIWLHLNPIIGAKLINVLAGGGILVLLYLILKRFGLADRKLLTLFLFGLVPTLLVWTFPGPITPDILFVLVLLGEVILLDNWLKRPSWLSSLALGASGALLYFTKSFGFYLFIGQLLVVLALDAYSQKRWRFNVQSGAKVALFFLVIASPFIVAVSIKYHKPTISTTGSYNLNSQAPKWITQPVIHPNQYGPLAPPNPSAYSASEDPGLFSEPHWSILGSRQNLKYFISLVWNNMQSIRDFIIGFGALSVVGFITLIAMLLVYFKRAPGLKSITGVTVLLLCAGYSLVLVEGRYLWAIVPLALAGIAAFYVENTRRSKYPVLVYVMGLLLIISVIWTSWSPLFSNKYAGRDIYRYSMSLANQIPKGSRVVSNNTHMAMYTAYYDDFHSYGIIKPTSIAGRDNSLYQELKRFGVTYYIDYLNVQAPKYT
ncbi:MAG TPA: hypothetical protein VHD84_00005, partial [Candidatus Saccharimonadales bacterium]|nr:hypothetical protein [Candidatus Saccharimonadales bacterium]